MTLEAKADRVQGLLRAGRTVAAAGPVQAPAIEGIVGVGGREGQLRRQLGAVDSVGFVLGVGLRIEQRRVPGPAPLVALQATQEAGLIVLDLDLAGAQIVEPIVGEGHRAAGGRHIGQVRQAVGIDRAVGEGHRAKRVVIVGRRHADRHQAGALGGLALGLGVVEAQLAIGRDRIGQVEMAVEEHVLTADLGRDGRGIADRCVIAEEIGR